MAHIKHIVKVDRVNVNYRIDSIAPIWKVGEHKNLKKTGGHRKSPNQNKYFNDLNH